MKPVYLSLFGPIIACLTVVAFPSVSIAATDAWDGSTDATWATGINWVLDTTAPGSAETATFNSAGNGFTTINLGAGVTVGSIIFDTPNAAAYTIGSGGSGAQTLTLGTLIGGIQMNSTVTNNQLINANLALSTTGTYTIGLTNNSLTNSLTVAGGISASTAGAKFLTVTGSGNTSVTGNITAGSGSVALTKTGTGTLSLSGVNATGNGAYLISGGTLNITGGSNDTGTGNLSVGSTTGIARVNLTGNSTYTSATTGFTQYVGNATNAVGVINIASGSTLSTTTATATAGGNIGGFANSAGAIYNAGTLNNNAAAAAGAGFFLGNAAGAYGYLQSSGTTNVSARLGLGQTAGGAGVVDISGGTTTLGGTGQTAGNSALQINSGSTGSGSVSALNITNGGQLVITRAGSQSYSVNNGTNNYASINIHGAGSLLNLNLSATPTSGINLGQNTTGTGNVATLTVSNGGTIATNYIARSGAVANTTTLSFNGGTVKASGASDVNGLIQASLTNVFVESGGGSIDNSGFNASINHALQAPTGSGVTSVTLGGTLTGYIGAPVVKITGDGTGAAGYANFDPTTGAITGITITSAGSGYTTATITLLGGSGTNGLGAAAGAAAATANLGLVSSGGMTFTGTGTTTLTSANTYTGATDVRQGTVQLTGSLSSSSALNVGNGSNRGKFILGNNTAAVNQTVSGLTSTGTGTTNAVVGGHTSTSTLTVNLASGTNTYAGALGGSGTNENNLALNKSGNGTLTLTGTNTYTGSTTVSAGTMYVSGSLGNTAVSVASLASIGAGDSDGGSLGGNLFFNSGAFLDISNGLLTVANGTTVSFGNFDFNNIIGLNVYTAATGAYTVIDGTFTLDSTNLNHFGESNALDLGNGNKAWFSQGSLIVNIAAIPEPSYILLSSIGLLGLLRRRRI